MQRLSRTTYSGVNADYDSRLVDGRYVTSVPIVGFEEEIDEGNLRPVHRVPPTLSNGKILGVGNVSQSLMDRLSRLYHFSALKFFWVDKDQKDNEYLVSMTHSYVERVASWEKIAF